MSDGSLELQGAIVARLSTDPALRRLIGDAIYDEVPEGTPAPYVTYDEPQVIADRSDCACGSEAYPTLHIWSDGPGFPECKRIAGAIMTALDGADLDLPGFHLVDLALEDVRYLRDPDGTRRHAVVTLKALIEPAD